MLKVPSAAQNRTIIPIISPTSPTRVVMKALRAASLLAFSSHQWPMSVNEQTPTSSHTTRSPELLLATTGSEHRGGEQRQEGEEVGVPPVAGHVVGGVHVDEQRHQRDDQQHHHGRAVEQHADLDVDAAVLEPGPRPGDRPNLEVRLLFLLGLLLSWAADAEVADGRGEGAALLLDDLLGVGSGLVLGVVDVPAPLDAGDDREGEGEADGGDADLAGALAGQLLPEEQDQEEAGRGDRGMIQALSSTLSPSSSRRRPGRRLTGQVDDQHHARPTPTSAAATAITNSEHGVRHVAVHGAEGPAG